MDLVAGDTARTDRELRFDQSDAALSSDSFHVPKNGRTQGLITPSVLPASVHRSADEDSLYGKRQRTSNTSMCCPVLARPQSSSQQEAVRSGECTAGVTFRGKDQGALSSHAAQGEHCWATRSGSRVTALYSELVRELETQVAELHEILASRDEAAAVREWRIQELEGENQELKRQIRCLEEQNDELSHRSPDAPSDGNRLVGPESHSVAVNESNRSFLKNLTGFLETNSTPPMSAPLTSSSPISLTDPKFTRPEVPTSPVIPHAIEPGPPTTTPEEVSNSPSEGMLRVSGVTSGFQYWMKMDESGENTLPESCVLWDEPLQETLPDGSPAWASPVEGNGRPKLELVPSSGVYITYQQLEDLSHIPPDKPKLMTRRLLDYFFSRETLARSSATGQRIAHNNTTMEKPLRLPDKVVTAIKAYVTRACGRGCNFNAVINSKCGTSRRAVKKMSIRIDWTEGGAKLCPRGAPGLLAQKGHNQMERTQVLAIRGTDPLLPQSVPQNS
ncbi:uncharacterized protein LOC495228 [Xenopus laevis]|uniref:LOC495228 protein n=1 Tax=Xenopus laevis TaxID=8355 RepID=Q5XG27_XENLA|nr:uncharacterized protein LOC495228 [Xenopus laevis]AAH84643.1 LOC495228 protein [Xenopus laevis]